jgi:serine protease Do
VRQLEEGEPVYAFGYPLPESQLEQPDPNTLVGTTTLHPRVTSAVVAADRGSYGGFMTPNDPQIYVLDKALNYGNSGGPIIATETGHAHAVCSRFHPVYVPQRHLADEHGHFPWIMIPSLYGYVSSLANPRLAEFLRANGAPITDE